MKASQLEGQVREEELSNFVTRARDQHLRDSFPSRDYQQEYQRDFSKEYQRDHERDFKKDCSYQRDYLQASKKSRTSITADLTTNQRIEEIKRKYDTPSRRERIESMHKSKDLRQNKERDYKENIGVRASALYPTNHYLKESFAVNKMDKSLMECNQKSYEKKEQKREDQETIFSRMREMKESFIERARPFRPISTMQDNKHIDPRIENIDKINFKIKHILSCLNENQKNTSKYSRPSIEQQNSNRESACFGSRLEPETQESKHFRDRSCDIVKQGLRFQTNKHLQDKYQYQDYKQYKDNKECTLDKEYKSPLLDNRLSNHPHNPIYLPNQIKSQAITPNPYTPNRVKIQQNKPFNEYKPEIKAPAIQSVDFWRNRSIMATKKEAMMASRSRSYIDSVKKSNLNGEQRQNNYLLTSGKKINDEITRIQRKIQQFQEEKKKLNIQFTPFSAKTKSTTNLLHAINYARKPIQQYSGSQQTTVIERIRAISTPFTPEEQPLRSNLKQDKDKKQYDNNIQSNKHIKQNEGYVNKSNIIYQENDKKRDSLKMSQRYRERAMSSIHGKQREILNNINNTINSVNISINGSINKEKKNQDYSSSRMGINNQQTQTNRVNRQKQIEKEKNIEREKQRQMERERQKQMEKQKQMEREKKIEKQMCRRADEGIEERRRRLNLNTERSARTETKRLVMKLCEQAKIDEQLRNQKIWYDCNSDGDKFKAIAALLPQSRDLAAELNVSQDQHNPFFTTHNFVSSIEQLAKVYKQANQYWNEEIVNNFSRTELMKEQFNESKMDLERKGYIQLGDLVRFLNIESGTFLRNRDVYLIYKRITHGQKLEFNQLLDTLCQ